MSGPSSLPSRFAGAILRDLVQHTHHSAWSVFHGILCGEAHRASEYLSLLEQRQSECEIHVFHGSADELVPVECSIRLQNRHPRARLQLLPGLNHFSILYGREMSFARTLHRIWHSSSKPS
jgi:pimeloyl-ACP methyl ester carboxylesterase